MNSKEQRLVAQTRELYPDALSITATCEGAHAALIVDGCEVAAAWSGRCDPLSLLLAAVASRVQGPLERARPSVPKTESAMLLAIAAAAEQLTPDQPITFTRLVPSKFGPVNVHVQIDRDLGVHVYATSGHPREELHGGYFSGNVYWDEDHDPTPLLCSTSRAMLAADVGGALSIFREEYGGGYLRASQWTRSEQARHEFRD